ncbi:MAG: hypothetical protein RLY16_2557 [Bacteroidota bacterium]
MLRNKLGLGSVQFGVAYGISNTSGQTPAEEVSHILQIAQQQGVSLIDTASGYGNAETVLGMNNLDAFKVVSKFLPPTAEISIEVQLQQSLQHLGLTQLYGYLAHRPEDVLRHPEQWKILLQLKADGLVQKIGFSLNTTDNLAALLEAGMVPDLIQVPYNFVDRRFENAMQTLHQQGCEIHTRSAFWQGLFFREPQGLPHFFEPVKPLLTAMQQLPNLPASLLQFVAQQSFIDRVIIGVENQQQLLQNIQNLQQPNVTLPMATIAVSDEILMPANWPKT